MGNILHRLWAQKQHSCEQLGEHGPEMYYTVCYTESHKSGGLCSIGHSLRVTTSEFNTMEEVINNKQRSAGINSFIYLQKKIFGLVWKHDNWLSTFTHLMCESVCVCVPDEDGPSGSLHTRFVTFEL